MSSLSSQASVPTRTDTCPRYKGGSALFGFLLPKHNSVNINKFSLLTAVTALWIIGGIRAFECADLNQDLKLERASVVRNKQECFHYWVRFLPRGWVLFSSHQFSLLSSPRHTGFSPLWAAGGQGGAHSCSAGALSSLWQLISHWALSCSVLQYKSLKTCLCQWGEHVRWSSQVMFHVYNALLISTSWIKFSDYRDFCFYQ